MMATDAITRSTNRGFPAENAESRCLGPARSATSPPRSSRSRTPASAIPSPTSGAPRTAARIQAGAACGLLRLFPVDAADFEDLRAAMGRFRLNDASFSYEMETSAALGFGFRCGFLGLLHLEIIQERLEREFNLDLIATAPSVIYKIEMTTRRTSSCTIRPTCPMSSRSPRSRSPGSGRRSLPRTIISARS